MLKQILKDQPGKRMHWKVCCKVFKQIVLAMQAYHNHNIAHRDLKPDNILVNMESKTYETKIIDFGFAAKSKEKLQVFCGTPAFMAPEICNKQHYDG